MKLSISLSIALIVLILDLASKYWVESALEFGQSIALTSFLFLLIYNIEGTRSFYCRQSDLHHIVKSCVSRPADIGLVVHYSVMFLYNKATSMPTS